MHKEYFLLKLKYGLMSLPAEDRDEILAEYSAHFAFGEQQGRTEEEIARELGDPEELAVELLGARDEGAFGGDKGRADQPSDFYRPDMDRGPDMQGPSYGPHGTPHGVPHGTSYGAPHGASYGAPPMPPPMYDMPYRDGYGPPSRSAIRIIAAIFSCFFAVPLVIAGWGLCVALACVAFVLLIGPLLYLLKLAFGGAFYGAEMSVMFIMFGIGIFMIQGIGLLFRAYGRLNRIYFQWVAGRERR
ncbi:DUF1700 domain-containing protein [Paenibacillus melissococcoides]|uniref:DUF1700 domain-containing protein n=2 Tax=Paenibacillus melissococcoides TaxID=2912268 RepID=A0ABM9G980_9BACL|nr:MULTISPECIES: DUF1700 domain-containing protein [Paenibacillus]MEB9893747.1 DUF1700 domain-containing protein [Bacillus cereus]CAH8248580.1 DUF1700 domain-containing protein [Paenibacillus melissococcoides]CAH8714345.1 DUF1700 domain-containing protein [Paenibacillus melissococcoides]CAH8719889.1 DUF1700 domain-containing protein [Paenibacillus melissococcoides]GIO79591.1 hypothetical protein J6TS7_32010 [Paenibacillus dendritiformis]